MTSVESQERVRHLAVVMDGNQRWARARGLAGPEGHKAGAKAVKTLVKAAAKANIEHLTLFAFSSENWRRPQYEVELLMQLFCQSLDEQLPDLDRNQVKLRFIGELNDFSKELQSQMVQAQIKTSKNTGLELVIAVNYGGQWDLANAARRMSVELIQAELDSGQNRDKGCEAFARALIKRVQSSDVDTYASYLALGDLPPVDLFIRTSGEQRISNFVLWQLAYAELYFTDTFWPDFDELSLYEALEDFRRRHRRFGQSSEELSRTGRRQ